MHKIIQSVQAQAYLCLRQQAQDLKIVFIRIWHLVINFARSCFMKYVITHIKHKGLSDRISPSHVVVNVHVMLLLQLVLCSFAVNSCFSRIFLGKGSIPKNNLLS